MSQKAKYDPLLFKLPKGAITKGQEVTFSIEYYDDVRPNQVCFMVKADGDDFYRYLPMKKTQNGYKISHVFNEKGHFWYNFQFVYEEYCEYLNRTPDNYSFVSSEKQDDFLQLVTEEEYNCTNSMQGGIIYQIFVDRFCKVGNPVQREPLVLREDWGGAIKKNTDDPVKLNLEVFGGNIQGIISKLDYIKGLGVTTIYLSPVSQASSNHKYNTSNYMMIDSMFGTEQDFKQLVETAKQKGMGIVIDGVYNHTGSDSVYFDKESKFENHGAFENRDSRFYDWYEFEDYPNKYRCWWGIDTLPSINRNSADFQNYIAGKGGVLEKFLKLGVRGVRLDVVDEITDQFVKKIEKKVHEFNENNVILGEVWEDVSTKISYDERRKYFVDNELNSAMNYPIKESVLKYIFTKNSDELISTIRMIENSYPKVVRDNLMNFLTTHDTRRVFSELLSHYDGNYDMALRAYKIAMILVFTLPGVPSIFYGDEYGMQDNDGSSRNCFDWKGYDNDIYKWVTKLTKIRQLPVLKDGEINVLYSANGKFAFERYDDDERLIVIANLSDSPFDINLEGDFESFFTGKQIKNHTVDPNDFDIIYEAKKD